MKKAIASKKKKMFDVEPASSPDKSGPKRASITKADNGYVIDFDFGMKQKIAKSFSEIADLLEEHFE